MKKTYREMTEAEQMAADELLHSKIDAANGAIGFLNRRRNMPDCPNREYEKIRVKILSLEGLLVKLELQLKALHQSRISITPPTQAQIEEVKALTERVESLNADQAIAAATWTLIGSLLQTARPLATKPK